MSALESDRRSGWVSVWLGICRRRRKAPIHLLAGEPLTPTALWCAMKKYARLDEVEGVILHTFRHSVATRRVRDPEVDPSLDPSWMPNNPPNTPRDKRSNAAAYCIAEEVPIAADQQAAVWQMADRARTHSVPLPLLPKR